jgi:serine/threonine protein kinase
MRCPSCGNENREGARFCDSCGSELTAEPAAADPRQELLPADVPTEIAGRYRVKRFLGQGGRKRVYLSDDTATGTEVALALFDTEGVGAAIQARTRREAEAMRKLGDHPQVVTVLDTGEEDGNPFIVSRYMPGGDVEGLLAAAGGRLEVQRAVEIAADVTRALEHTHARGVVHRDLKPANVWIDDDGHARLGDFGLATTEARSRVSGGTLVGTVAYLPPEQALGEASGPQSDLYSLGALLYEMLSGQPPFPGDDAVSIISQHLHADPVTPSRHNPEVPEALDRVVLALLAKRPEDRPANAAEARERMLAALEEKPAEVADQPRANPRRPRIPPAARRRAGDRQDACGRGTRDLRAGERCAGLLGPLPRGRGRPRILALGTGDPLLRPRRRPGRARLAARRRSRGGRPADPRGCREARR